MFTPSKFFRAGLLSAACAAALTGAPVLAAPFPMVNTFAGPNFGDADIDMNSLTPTASVSSSSVDGLDSRFAAASATTGYRTSAQADIEGSGIASAEAKLTETVTNDTADTREFFFTFQINGGTLQIEADDLDIGPMDTANAAFSSQVSVDGNEQWQIDVEIELFEDVLTLTDGNSLMDDDALLNGFTSTTDVGFIEAFWNPTTFTVSLGELAPDESLELGYLLSASVDAMFAEACVEADGYGYGYGYGYGVLDACYFTLANVTDPGAVSSFGISSEIVDAMPPSPVPEPESLALLGIGLAGLGLARRRRFDL